MSAQRVQCQHCKADLSVTATEKLIWLQRLGHLRKLKDPESEMVQEMFRQMLRDLPCPACRKAGGMVIGFAVTASAAAKFSQVEEDDTQWGMQRACVDCKRPIATERLEIFPNATRCGSCQQKLETKPDMRFDDPADFTDQTCPRCGQFLKTIRQRSSLQPFKFVCGDCGYSPKR